VALLGVYLVVGLVVLGVVIVRHKNRGVVEGFVLLTLCGAIALLRVTNVIPSNLSLVARVSNVVLAVVGASLVIRAFRQSDT
jgi:hypothetical protein